MLRDILQYAAFTGDILSLLIVISIIRIGSPFKLTFLNKMFLIYFSVDSIIGTLETHLLFKLKEERYNILIFNIIH